MPSGDASFRSPEVLLGVTEAVLCGLIRVVLVGIEKSEVVRLVSGRQHLVFYRYELAVLPRERFSELPETDVNAVSIS